MESTPLAAADAPVVGSPQLGDPRSTSEERVRVLHVINGEHYAGAERVQDLLALKLPQFGFDVGFAAIKAGRFGDVRQAVDAPLAEASMGSRWDLGAANLVARMYRDGDYQLLHAHTPRSVMIASLAALQVEAPLVYHVHSPTSRDSTHWFRNWVNDRVERWSIRGAERLITVSPSLTEHMRNMGFTDERIRCVLNGVPSVAGAAPRTRPEGAWTFGMVALFRPRKGAEILLESLAALRAEGHDARLRMIGSFEADEYKAELLALAESLGLTEAIDWTGFTTNVAVELEKVDALVLPSLFGEGLPMVVLEAMASALPVVGTRCEGVERAVADRRTGLLVEPNSAADLTRALAELVRGDLDYQALSAAALERHAAEFSDDTMAARVADAYREVLGVTA